MERQLMTHLHKTLNLAWLKLALLSSATLLAPTSFAESAEDKGLRISQERKQQDTGWVNSEQNMQMILRNANGQESIREMRIKSLEVENDGDKGLTIFDKPHDVKGSAFLSFSHINKADDQWLYLPALKRVKRISSRNKSGPFMGSEFAYEDLSSFELEKYSFTYLRDEPCPNQAELSCYVVQSIPKDKFSGYTRQVAWLDKQEYRVFKVDFYDKKKSLLKTMTSTDYKLYKDKFWRAHSSTMINHQTQKSTHLKTSNINFDIKLKKSDFNKNSLKRIR